MTEQLSLHFIFASETFLIMLDTGHYDSFRLPKKAIQRMLFHNSFIDLLRNRRQISLN